MAAILSGGRWFNCQCNTQMVDKHCIYRCPSAWHCQGISRYSPNEQIFLQGFFSLKSFQLIWPWKMWLWFQMCKFQMQLEDGNLEYSSKHYPGMNARGPRWWLVNIGSGNGLVPSGNKPSLPEPKLTHIYVTTWHHWAIMPLLITWHISKWPTRAQAIPQYKESQPDEVHMLQWMGWP